SGRCAVGGHSHGRRGYRRTIRRARGTEDEGRTAPSPARASRARSRNPVCARSRSATGSSLLDPSSGCRHVTRCYALAIITVFGALTVSAGPGAAERLVTSLSDHRVMVTSSFIGEQLVLFGGIEQDAASRPRRSGYDVVITVTGPRQTAVTFRKQRALGIWVNADSRVFENAPAYLAVLSNRPLEAITNAEMLRRMQLGLDNIPLP